jgi:predicted DCC family thiol-disulfide oxidoreductase YuxK
VKQRPTKSPVILFDGVCNLCNNAVTYVITKDRDAIFRFASLQSDKGKDLVKLFGLDPGKLFSIVLVEDDRLFLRSDAILRIASRLDGWKWTRSLTVIPRFVRDFVYNVIAGSRYRLFGRRAQCMVPSPELKARFLDS